MMLRKKRIHSAATDDLREGGWIGTRNTRPKNPTPSRDAPRAVARPLAGRSLSHQESRGCADKAGREDARRVGRRESDQRVGEVLVHPDP